MSWTRVTNSVTLKSLAIMVSKSAIGGRYNFSPSSMVLTAQEGPESLATRRLALTASSQLVGCTRSLMKTKVMSSSTQDPTVTITRIPRIPSHPVPALSRSKLRSDCASRSECCELLDPARAKAMRLPCDCGQQLGFGTTGFTAWPRCN